jgi:hypothetical protein
LLLKGGNVTLQIGEEEVSLVKHADNTGLTEGKVVYIVGADGTNKTVRYALATADATSATTFGLMTESATGGNKAFCTTFGLVRNLNTTNLTEGGIVWLSADTAGAMTAVRPTAPKHGVMIGFCVRKHATQGAIFVQVQNGYELNELHDVFVPNPINNQVLTWDNTDKRWEAKTVADSSATNELQTLSVAANTATLSNSGGSVTIAGAGINTVGTAGTTITVTGTEVDGSVSNELQTLSTGTNTLTLSNGGGTVTVDTDPASDVTGSGTSGQVAFWTGMQTQSGSTGLTFDNNLRNLELSAPSTRDPYFRVVGGTVDFRLQTFGAFGYANFGTYSNHPYFIFANNGPVARFSSDGRFTLAPAFPSNWNTSERMQVNGSVRFTETTYLSTQSGFNTIVGSYTAPAARLHVVGSGSTSSTWTAQFHNSATGGNNALMIRDDGNIGVRTNAPTDLIDINGANGYSQLRLRTAYTPTGTADTNGNTGDVSWDDNYIYIKTAAGWKRSALSTF